MKILWLCEEFPQVAQRSPSLSLVAAEHIKIQRSLGCDVRVVALAYTASQLRNIWRMAAALLSFTHQSLACDLVIIGNAKGAVFISLFKALTRKRVAVFCHDLAPVELIETFGGTPLEQRRMLQQRRRKIKACAAADYVLTLSEESQSNIRRACPLAKVHVFYNAVEPLAKRASAYPASESRELNVLDIKDMRPIILAVTALERRKNLDVVIKAIAAMDANRVQFILVGAAKDASVVKVVNKASGAENFRWYSRVDNSELNQLMNQAAIVLCPGLHEGFGRVGIEAQLAHTPVIATDEPVQREILGDGAAFVRPGHCSTAWQHTIEKVLKNAEIRSEIVAKGAENAERFEPLAIGDRWRKFLNLIDG